MAITVAMGWFQPDSGQYSGYRCGNSLIVASTATKGVDQSASTVARGVVSV